MMFCSYSWVPYRTSEDNEIFQKDNNTNTSLLYSASPKLEGSPEVALKDGKEYFAQLTIQSKRLAQIF